ncbi:MAG: aminopeptidase [Lachnospiraceae bacterium]|nr:aminopeptidase [Lachnospiraceae bacterium]
MSTQLSKNAWLKYDKKTMSAVMDFAEEYRRFLSANKTERECADAIVKKAKSLGFKNIADVKKAKAGDKIYASLMGKIVALFVVGSEPLENGMKILGAHIDSPRLDLKQVPVYEDDYTEIALLDTHYYGGIKKYQWVTIPLAMHGVICRKDGTTVKVNIGDEPGDPVFGVSDLLIHLGADQLQKKGATVVEGEDLNVTFATIPLKGEKEYAVRANVWKLLSKKYGVEEDDFLSAEIEIVPAGEARDMGIDSSLLMGYGHDDRCCAYPSAEALFRVVSDETNIPAWHGRTMVCLLVDKEEIGSVGATGMHSKFFENTVAELLDRMGEYSELKLRRAMQNSVMLSSDVSAAYDPNYAGVFERKNAAYFGCGLVFNKYTGSRGKSGSNDANPEYFAKIRKAFDDANVSFQTAELGKVDQGGGGTIAYIMGNYGMNVIDCGVAVQNMHAPWEVISKADLYEALQGYLAFYRAM